MMKVAMLEDEICSILIRCGISQNLKGYLYLKEAILLAVENPSITFQLTKILYPMIADIYDTTPECVERSMRHAIDKSWNESLLYGLEFTMIFVRKPSNGVFIKNLARYFLREGVLSWKSVWREEFQNC